MRVIIKGYALLPASAKSPNTWHKFSLMDLKSQETADFLVNEVNLKKVFISDTSPDNAVTHLQACFDQTEKPKMYDAEVNSFGFRKTLDSLSQVQE